MEFELTITNNINGGQFAIQANSQTTIDILKLKISAS